ncbi:MAG TPA: hypothetical protein DIW31_09690 [Bacteroidales bacterium]|nr:hypothetical protein [Bacteroidales bacterium]
MKNSRILIAIALLLISFNANSTVVVINQSGSSFSPKTFTVNVGDVIRWVWSSGTHTTTSTTIPQGAAGWDASLTSTSTTFEYTVTVAGAYSYVCSIHESSGMVGSFTASAPTSIGENLLSDYKVYPNPTTSIINLPLDLNGKIHLYDILGKEVKIVSTTELKGANSCQLDVSDLTNGVYFIGYIPEVSKKKITWKVIKK